MTNAREKPRYRIAGRWAGGICHSSILAFIILVLAFVIPGIWHSWHSSFLAFFIRPLAFPPAVATGAPAGIMLHDDYGNPQSAIRNPQCFKDPVA